MTTRFEAYGRTPLGQQLASIVTAADRYPDYRAFSREGFPAVTALISSLKPELQPLRLAGRHGFDAAKTFVGWAVAHIMRARGHMVVGRSSVPGGLFTIGAIWNAGPTPATR